MSRAPEPPVDLTAALRQVEANVRALLASGLTRKAVVVLIAHDTGLSQRVVEQVLAAATSLSKWTAPAKAGA